MEITHYHGRMELSVRCPCFCVNAVLNTFGITVLGSSQHNNGRYTSLILGYFTKEHRSDHAWNDWSINMFVSTAINWLYRDSQSCDDATKAKVLDRMTDVAQEAFGLGRPRKYSFSSTSDDRWVSNLWFAVKYTSLDWPILWQRS